jgi:hypothetical protein
MMLTMTVLLAWAALLPPVLFLMCCLQVSWHLLLMAWKPSLPSQWPVYFA